MQEHRRQPHLLSIPAPRHVLYLITWKENLKLRDIQLKNPQLSFQQTLPNIHTYFVTYKSHHAALAGLELSLDKSGLKLETIPLLSRSCPPLQEGQYYIKKKSWCVVSDKRDWRDMTDTTWNYGLDPDWIDVTWTTDKICIWNVYYIIKGSVFLFHNSWD